MKMLLLILVLVILFPTIILNAQRLTISFDSLDAEYTNNVYLIDCSEMGNLKTGISSFLIDSVVMRNKKGSVQLPSNAVAGFYRIQNLPRALPAYAFLNKIPSSMYLYLDQKSHRQLRLHLHSNKDYDPVLIEGIDADNQELILTQLKLNKECAILMKKISAVNHYGRNQLYADNVRLLCRLFTQSHSDIVKIFLALQIHQSAELMDIKRFHELVPIDYRKGYRPEFMSNVLYQQFNKYVRE